MLENSTLDNLKVNKIWTRDDSKMLKFENRNVGDEIRVNFVDSR